MCCETENVITYADVSVNSEYDTILRLNHYAQIHDKPHKVILMADLGDIREGFTDYQELLRWLGPWNHWIILSFMALAQI